MIKFKFYQNFIYLSLKNGKRKYKSKCNNNRVYSRMPKKNV